MAMNPVELRIIIDAQNKASAVLKSAQKDIGSLQQKVSSVAPATRGMEDGFSRIGASAKRGGIAIMGVGHRLTAVGGKIWPIAAAGTALTAMGKSGALLEARITALGGTFDETKTRLHKLSEASDGAFSMPELVDAESKIKSFDIGLKLTAPMLQNIQGRAAQMGISTTKALEDIILATARGSRKIADNVGLVVSQKEENQRLAVALGKTVHQLTDAERRTAFTNGIMRELNKTTMNTTSAYGASLKASAHLKDGMAKLQLALAPVMLAVEPLADIFLTLAGTMAKTLAPAVKLVAIATRVLNTALGQILKGALSLIGLALSPLISVFKALGSSFEKTTKKLAPYTSATKLAAEQTSNLADASRRATEALRAHGEVVRVNGALEVDHIALKTEHHAAVVKMTDAELRAIEMTGSANKGLTEQQKMKRQSLKIMKAEAEKRIAIARIKAEQSKRTKELDADLKKETINTDRYNKEISQLNAGSERRIKATNRTASALKKLAKQEAIAEDESKKRSVRRRADRKEEEEISGREHNLRAHAFAQQGVIFQEERRRERASLQILKEKDPLERARLEHLERQTQSQYQFNLAMKEMEVTTKASSYELEHLDEIMQNQTLVSQQQYLDQIWKIKDANAAKATREWAEATSYLSSEFRRASGVMQGMSPVMAVTHAAIGQIATTWLQFANNAKAGSKELGMAIAGTLSTIGPAAASAFEDVKTQAWIMSAFEAAASVAAFATGNVIAGSAHAAAAVMFAGVAKFGWGTKGATGAGGGSAAGLPGGGMVPAPQGDKGPGQVVINFTDGMILGDPQSLASKINEALDHASGNGLPQGV